MPRPAYKPMYLKCLEDIKILTEQINELQIVNKRNELITQENTLIKKELKLLNTQVQKLQNINEINERLKKENSQLKENKHTELMKSNNLSNKNIKLKKRLLKIESFNQTLQLRDSKINITVDSYKNDITGLHKKIKIYKQTITEDHTKIELLEEKIDTVKNINKKLMTIISKHKNNEEIIKDYETLKYHYFTEERENIYKKAMYECKKQRIILCHPEADRKITEKELYKMIEKYLT